MDKISFTSAIRPIPAKEFAKITGAMGGKNSVNFPWTIKEAVKAPNAYTTGILDCTVCGITDGKNVYQMHLCPDVDKNHHFSEIFRYIRQNIDLKNENLQGFLCGSRPHKKSQDIYNKFVEFFKNYNIPFTELKNAKNSFNVAYSSSKDEWMISDYHFDKFINANASSEDVLNKMFEKVRISDLDEIV